MLDVYVAAAAFRRYVTHVHCYFAAAADVIRHVTRHFDTRL